MAKSIYVADDELHIRNLIQTFLANEGYEVRTFADGDSLFQAFCERCPDLIILDIMMPKMNGFEVLAALRRKGNLAPVLMLTAKSEIDDKVTGLDMGANDYLTKPFDARELTARIRAMTRTQTDHGSSRLSFGNITLDRATFELSSPTGSICLANKEFQMLELMMCNPRQRISADRFMERIWGYDSEADVSVVWVYISYLRKKLASLQANIQIRAARNAGYSLEEQI